MGGFSENPVFQVLSLGAGARFYVSQLFWQQKTLRGFFVEAHVGGGYAVERPGEERGIAQPINRGATFNVAGSVGYTHAFDCGVIIGGGINYFGRVFFAPIKQRGFVIHPNPEILAHIGWAF